MERTNAELRSGARRFTAVDKAGRKEDDPAYDGTPDSYLMNGEGAFMLVDKFRRDDLAAGKVWTEDQRRTYEMLLDYVESLNELKVRGLSRPEAHARLAEAESIALGFMAGEPRDFEACRRRFDVALKNAMR